MPNSVLNQPPTAGVLPTVSYATLVDEKFSKTDEKLQRVWDKFAAVEKAIDKAAEDLAAYKLMANEFRGSLSDQRAQFPTKADLQAVKDLIEIQRLRIDKIETYAANVQGKLWMLAAVFAILQVVINIAQRFLTHVP